MVRPGSNSRPPRAQQTGALPTELTGWWLFQIINIDNLKRFKKASNILKTILNIDLMLQFNCNFMGPAN